MSQGRESQNVPPFAAIVAETAAREGIRLPALGIEPLAGLDYDDELRLKGKALHRFWRVHHRLAAEPEALVPSPRPRHYRTTSKRRVVQGRGGAWLLFTDGAAPRGVRAVGSLLEPLEHAAVFRCAAALLCRLPWSRATASLHYLILRGSYQELALILNAHTLDRHAVSALRGLAEELRGAGLGLSSAFIYFDPSRSPYYLELEQPQGSFRQKRLFGPGHFRVTVAGFQFHVPVTSFSQVNESLLPGLLAAAAALLGTEGKERLLDLFCGYGLFACTLGRGYREVIGVEAAPVSLAAAIEHGRALASPPRLVFQRLKIAKGNIVAVLPRAGAGIAEDVILDPPRNGVDRATIRAIALRRPRRVLHIFCSADEIPGALNTWGRFGYEPQRVIPLDMFAGTAGLEILVSLGRR